MVKLDYNLALSHEGTGIWRINNCNLQPKPPLSRRDSVSLCEVSIRTYGGDC